jgi:hypothetical protein
VDELPWVASSTGAQGGRARNPARNFGFGAFPGGKKAFFFEKRNQKTFATKSHALRKRAPKRIKVFCFFFSKKKRFLP